MKKLLTITCLFFIALSTSFAQTDWKAKLKESLVTVSDDKYEIEETVLITFSTSATIKFRTSAKGEMGAISKDQFISIYSSFGTFLMVSILQEADVKLDDVKITGLEDFVGEPDITINMTMNEDGLQMDIITEDGTENASLTWEEFFEK